MKKLILFLALLANCILPLHSRIPLPVTDIKEKIVVVGSDITALWSAYFLMQEIEARGLSKEWELHLVGENLDKNFDSSILLPMMMSGNIPQMIKEGKTREEIQHTISLQSRNQRLTTQFLSHFDHIGWNGKRAGSFLALEKGDVQTQVFYTESFFNFKLPLTRSYKDDLPLTIRRLFSPYYDLFDVPFDSLIDESLVRRLLFSSLLEERAEKPSVHLHLTTCENFLGLENGIFLQLVNGEILHTNACVINLESTTFPMIGKLCPEVEYETVLEAVLCADGFGSNPRQPYFVQFPSEDLLLTFGKGQNLYFYRKLIGLCHDEVKSIMIRQAQSLNPHVENLDFRLTTLYRPIESSSPILYPFGKERPIIVINQDQSERISQGATLGELSTKAVFDCFPIAN